MFSMFLGMFGTWLALAGTCHAENLERSSLTPLSIVYTVYPYYNSEGLLGIWKPEERLQVSGNVVALGSTPEGRETGNAAGPTAHDESSADSNSRDSYHNNSHETTHPRNNEMATEITYWPPVQRGAAPKPRLSRATVLQPANLKKVSHTSPQ